MRILITGASGFVGKNVCIQAKKCGFTVRSALRKFSQELIDSEQVVVGEINSTTDWGAALHEVDIVIHLAARVHVMHENAKDPLVAFRKVNVEGTENLVRAAALSGLKRLVFVSSIKVNGDKTFGPTRYDEENEPSPKDPYGISKWEAENALHRVAAETGIEVVTVRPPLVYGAEVKGNFIQMLNMLTKNIPLPLAAVKNMRSMIYVGNLVDALILCATHPAAVGQTYLVSDGEDISTSDLLLRLGSALDTPARLFFCPESLLRLGGKITGKSDQVERLLGSLQVDSGKIRRELNWAPPYTLQQGLQETAQWYRNAYL